MVQDSIDRAIQSQQWLDEVATPVQRFIMRLLSPGPTGSKLRDLLHGTFLGHPLHPALTDVPVGSWTAAMVLDVLSYVPFTRSFGIGADTAIALGVASVLPTAAAGLADWSLTRGHPRRVGTVHALANVSASLLYGTSLYMRARGKRGLGRGLAFLGYGVVAFGAYLGGELVFKHGMGAAPTAFERLPTRDWTDVGEESSLAPGEMRKVDVGGVPVLLAHPEGGEVLAIADTCTHMGCSLAKGRLRGDVVTCPCHGSEFELHSGMALRGPASVPEPRYDVSVLAGRIKVRPAEPA